MGGGVVANRIGLRQEVLRLGERMIAEAGRELRLARLLAGMRQVDVARQLGTSASRVCRIEHGRVRTVSFWHLVRHASVVGLRPWLGLYPAGRRPLDRPQLELLSDLRHRSHPMWTWETEKVMPRQGDLRAADAVIRNRTCSIVIEAFTRFADFQAQTRASEAKKRDLRADRLVLLVRGTHANRQAVRDGGTLIRESFPLATRELLAALAQGRDPGADGILIL